MRELHACFQCWANYPKLPSSHKNVFFCLFPQLNVWALLCEMNAELDTRRLFSHFSALHWKSSFSGLGLHAWFVISKIVLKPILGQCSTCKSVMWKLKASRTHVLRIDTLTSVGSTYTYDRRSRCHFKDLDKIIQLLFFFFIWQEEIRCNFCQSRSTYIHVETVWSSVLIMYITQQKIITAPFVVEDALTCHSMEKREDK